MQQICAQCSAGFEITDDDLQLYEQVSPVFNGKKELLPPPVKCPDCRYQQRLSWRNERNLHRRPVEPSGKMTVSIHAAHHDWPPVYEQAHWWSDNWDALSYGRDVDLNRSFFAQFAELYRVVPQIALNSYMAENSEYTNQSDYLKNCYMCISSGYSEDCYHNMWMTFGKNCMDSLYMEKGELCYEIVNGTQCYGCTDSMNLTNCSDLHFCRDCIGCHDCFGCVNLRNKQHYFFNQPCTEEEYAQKLAAYNLHTHSGRLRARKEFDAFAAPFPHKYYNGHTTERFSGDYLQEVQDAFRSYNCRKAEKIIDCYDAWWARNSRDLTETYESDHCISVEGSSTNNQSLFGMKLKNAHNILYCSHCFDSQNLIGCIGVRGKQYCILNKQYSKEEYEDVGSKIIERMRQDGEWGDHFSSQYSPFGYNESVAQEYFPLTKEEVLRRGWRWDDLPSIEIQAGKTVHAAQLPDSIDDVPDDILEWAITCEATDKPFRIIRQELDFYRRMHLPIPRLHPDERHRRRMALRNPRRLWQRTCDNCQKQITSTYAPDRSEKVFCEKCYLQSVN